MLHSSPERALRSYVMVRQDPTETAVRAGIDTGLSPYTVNGRSVPRILPLRPVWPGFAINALFYTLILWLLILGRHEHDLTTSSPALGHGSL